MSANLILNTDSYKTSHYLQYPPGTEVVSSYIESRGGVSAHTVFFGLQLFLKSWLARPVTAAEVDEAEAVLGAHGMPFNRAGWEHILREHGGWLPIAIEAVPEGTVVPVSNVLVQVCNTDPRVAWLTSYLETALLRAVWYPTTVATRSWACRQLIEGALEETAGSTEGVEFKLHDFGARGASSEETAAIGGAAHLLCFEGTDTLSGVMAARRYYGAAMAGFSIPAAEHSTITCWGREREANAYANMLVRFGGSGRTLAVVSDSWDLHAALRDLWGERLKDAIETSGGTVVIRPDSGEPEAIVLETMETLLGIFGHSTNARGYRVLPDCVRVIQGDGVSPEMIGKILKRLKHERISAENIAFGMGGELLQKVDRDTQQFAMKASAVRIDGVWHDVWKDPATDPGKRSKRGRLELIAGAGTFETRRRGATPDPGSILEPVYRNGELLKDQTFDEIRARLRETGASVGAPHLA